jgi:hypothetical protein
MMDRLYPGAMTRAIAKRIALLVRPWIYYLTNNRQCCRPTIQPVISNSAAPFTCILPRFFKHCKRFHNFLERRPELAYSSSARNRDCATANNIMTTTDMGAAGPGSGTAAAQ